jgi:hypothetical protein
VVIISLLGVYKPCPDIKRNLDPTSLVEMQELDELEE